MKNKKLLLTMLIAGCFGNNPKHDSKRKIEDKKQDEKKINKEDVKDLMSFHKKLNEMTAEIRAKLEVVKLINSEKEKEFHQSLMALPTTTHQHTEEVFEKILNQAENLQEKISEFLAKKDAFFSLKLKNEKVKKIIYLSEINSGILIPEDLELKRVNLVLPKEAEVNALEVIQENQVERKSNELKISSKFKDKAKNILKRNKKIITITLNEDAFYISNINELINNIEVKIGEKSQEFAILNIKEESLKNLSDKEKKEYIIVKE